MSSLIIELQKTKVENVLENLLLGQPSGESQESLQRWLAARNAPPSQVPVKLIGLLTLLITSDTHSAPA